MIETVTGTVGRSLKIFAGLLCAHAILGSSIAGAATKRAAAAPGKILSIHVKRPGPTSRRLDFKTPTYIVDGIVLVPVRHVGPIIEASVFYRTDRATQVAVHGRALTVTVGLATAHWPDGKAFRLSAAPVLRGASLYAPLRSVVAAFGYDTRWTPSTPLVVDVIYPRPRNPSLPPTPTSNVSPAAAQTPLLITVPRITAPPLPKLTAPPLTAPPLTAPVLTAPPMTAPPLTAPPIASTGAVRTPSPTPNLTPNAVAVATIPSGNFPTVTPSPSPPPPAQQAAGPPKTSPKPAPRSCEPRLLASPNCDYENTSAMFDSVILLNLAIVNVLLWLWIRRLQRRGVDDDGWAAALDVPKRRGISDALRRRALEIVLGLVLVLLLVQLGIVIFGGNGRSQGITVTSIGYVLPYFLNMVNSSVAMITVVAVVLLGFYLSLQQFALWVDGQKRLLQISERLTDKAAGEADHVNMVEIKRLFDHWQSSIELSAKNVKVDTPVVGVIVLALSLAFLFVALKFGNLTALH